MKIDFQAIRESTDLLDIARRYTTLNRSLQGPCPLCQEGTDRFFIHKGRQRWQCRKCENHGDAIDLVALCEGISKAEAVRLLAGDKFVTSRTPQLAAARPPDRGSEVDPEAAAKTIDQGVRLLPGSPGLAYAESRSLSAETLARYQIGFDPSKFDKDAKRDRPALVIPWLNLDGSVQAIKYRFIDSGTGRRYTALTGSRPELFGIQELPPNAAIFVIVEGELNALSCAEAYGNRAAVLSIGSEGNLRGVEDAAELRRTRYPNVPAVIWLDDVKHAVQASKAFKGKVRTMRSPNGLDANDILCQRGQRALRLLLQPPSEQWAMLKNLSDEVKSISSRENYQTTVSHVEALYEKTEDGDLRSLLFDLMRKAEMRLTSLTQGVVTSSKHTA